jgi:hypothetical protein
MVAIRIVVVLVYILLRCMYNNTGDLCAGSDARATISGHVYDSETGRPLFFVNVFLANTTIGTTTDKSGAFVIRNIPAGNYQLVLHHIGYRVETRPANTFEQTVLEFNVRLTPIALKGQTVEIIAAEPKQWRKHLKVFKREFLGTSKNAKKCEILNPEVLDFSTEGDADYLTARTDSVLRIVNHELGYKTDVILIDFRYYTYEDRIRYQIYPRFQDLALADTVAAEKWLKNRHSTMEGCLRHFLVAAVHDRLFEEGFTAMMVNQIGSRERKIWIDGKDLITSLSGNDKYIFFQGPLYVKYKRNEESWIELRNGAVKIDTLGNCWGQHTAITRYGHWGNHRFADCLPFDYRWDRP